MVTYQDGIAVLPPLAVALPILVAVLLVIVGKAAPRTVVDTLAASAAAATVALDAVLLLAASGGRVVTWVAGWRPHHGYSVGIVLESDPLGAGVALLSAALVTLALVYSARYFESVHAHYHSLLLMFLAGMQGFALTGDLFDMFVFFELMGAAAFALTAMQVEEPSSLQGAINFGVINSLGAYLSLMGIALLYGLTGSVGLPQLHHALAHRGPDALLVAAFVLVVTGFLVKGAMVPFHFWLADAHAVAPPPVCVLFSGVMVPLGLYAVFRVYWVVFSSVLPMGEVRRTFIVLGALTAVLGAVMCMAQRHLKRLLAYSTIAHVGLFLVALGCLNEEGTAGALVYVASHAGAKAALFLIAGVILNRYGSVDEIYLFGRGRGHHTMAWLMVVGGLALAAMPPFGTALGKAISEDAGVSLGYVWFPALFVLVSAMTGGAVLRVAGRIYFGLGHKPSREDQEPAGQEEREARFEQLPWTMLLPIVVLLAGALAIGILPGVHQAAEHAAAWFVDPTGYARQALYGAPVPVPSMTTGNWTREGLALGFTSAVLAVALAAAGLFGTSLSNRLPALRLARRPVHMLQRLHSGHVGDYVAWLMMGVAVLGGFIGLPVR